MDEHTENDTSRLQIASQEAVDLIYDTLACIHRVFVKNALPYTIFSGTALGAERHGGLIPWDDDADTAILSNNEHKLVALSDAFAQLGFTLEKVPFFGYRLYHSTLAKPRPFDQFPYPFVDIFLIDDTGSSYEYITDEAREYWPASPLPYGCFNRLVDQPFGHLTVRGLTPEDMKKHLDDNYGKDWPYVASREYDHYYYKNVPNIRVSLKEGQTKRPALHSKHQRSVQPLKVMNNLKA